MAQISFWNFDEFSGSTSAGDSITTDAGGAQNGSVEGGAVVDGTGAVQLDGNDGYIEVADDGSFDLESGSIVIDFTQISASAGDVPWGGNAAQTLFSRDSSGFDNGGHLSIYIKSDGSVGVRHQTENSDHFFEGGDIVLGEASTVIYTWGPEGSQLIVDGVVVDSGTEALTLVGDNQPVVIGASQAQSDDGVASPLTGFFDGEISGAAIYDEIVDPETLACLVKGTLIETSKGMVAVEDLIVGDMVKTMDHGFQALGWVDSTSVPGVGKMAPVRIAKGALGNEREMRMSPHHRILATGWRAQALFGETEVLVAAIDLVNDSTIRQVQSANEVVYFHLGFEDHEIIFAEGIPTESFAATESGLAALPETTREEFLALFPKYASAEAGEVVTARPCLSSQEARSLSLG